MTEEKLIKKTRKNHCCDLCLRRIPKGFSAHYFKGINDGEFFKSYFCNTCYKLATEFSRYVADNWDGFYDPQILQDSMNDFEVKTPLQLYNRLKKDFKDNNNDSN